MRLHCDVRYCPGMCTRPSNVRLPSIGRALIALLLVWGALSIALCAVLMRFPAENPTLDVVYGTLGIYCVVWQVYFGVDAVLSENEFQYAAMHVTSVVFTAFIIWNVFHNATSLGPIWDDHGGIGRWTVLGIASAVQIALLCLARPVWNSFGFFAYKVVGASIPLKSAFLRYRAFLSLVKYDLFAATTLLILARFYLPGMHRGAPEFTLSVIALVVSVAFAVVAWHAITHEKKVIAAVASVLALFEPAFIGYEYFIVYADASSLPSGVTPNQFVILGSIAILVRLALIYSAYLCYRNFGAGLRSAFFKRDAHEGSAGVSVAASLTDPLLIPASKSHRAPPIAGGLSAHSSLNSTSIGISAHDVLHVLPRLQPGDVAGPLQPQPAPGGEQSPVAEGANDGFGFVPMRGGYYAD